MKLRDFFERVMRAAAGPVRWSDVAAAEMAAHTDRHARRPQNGPRNAQRAAPTGNTQNGRKAHERKSKP